MTLKLDPSHEQTMQYSMRHGPKWKDGCEHGAEHYICTFTVMDSSRGLNAYDLYLFPEHFFGTEVCIRYGDEPSQYISPGGLGQFLYTSGVNWKESPVYTQASQILREFGCFNWQPRIERKDNHGSSQGRVEASA